MGLETSFLRMPIKGPSWGSCLMFDLFLGNFGSSLYKLTKEEIHKNITPNAHFGLHNNYNIFLLNFSFF